MLHTFASNNCRLALVKQVATITSAADRIYKARSVSASSVRTVCRVH